MSQANYAKAYNTYGESLMGYGFSKQFKPSYMSNSDWLGAPGKKWRTNAVRNKMKLEYGSKWKDGGRRRRTKRRRGTKRSTRRR
jgi:hypothetical protein